MSDTKKKGKRFSTRGKHDELFKAAFTFKSVLLEYIGQFLPKELATRIDTESLMLDTTSYIDEQMKAFFSDVVWEARYGDVRIKIGILFEHKSYPTEFIHLQLLRYMLQKWENAIKSKEPMSVIIPVVVYHNADNQHWELRDFKAYFEEIDEVLLRYIPRFEYELLDITQLSDEEILAQKLGLLGITLMAFKHGSDSNYIQNNFNIIFKDAEKYIKDEQSISLLRMIYLYLMYNSRITPNKMKQLVEQQAAPATKTILMSTYDLIKKEGLQEGLKEGLKEGEVRLAEKTRKIISKIIKKYPEWSDTEIAELTEMDIEQVQAVREALNEK